MSKNLYWQPVIPRTPDTLSDELKRLFARTLWDSDGSLYCEPLRLTADDVPYLTGLRDVGVMRMATAGMAIEVANLITAIRKHGAVEIWIAE